MATTRKYREGMAERLGLVPGRVLTSGETRPLIWIHAVSVGEVIAIGRLASELKLRAPGYRIVVSTTTRTGQQIARERFGAKNVFYYPLDFAFSVRRYLLALRPELFVLAETEFWPRMLTECRRAAIPVAVVNARISDRSYPRYLRLRLLWKRILGNVSLALAQTETDLARLRAIGVPKERARLGGNLKYDIRPASSSPLVEAIRHALPADARLLVCGSTLEGEEKTILEAWPRLTAEEPGLRMVLAPRHPERFAAVAASLQLSGVRWTRRSQWTADSALALDAGSVLLLDSIGELASIYSLATLAFVGGSLVPAGGHNPLEPAQFGVPILMGPHYENFREIVEKLLAQDAICIGEPATLTGTLLKLLREDDTAMGERARAVFKSESGATERTVAALLALLPGETV